ncbi:MAG: aromatic-ring-hydroxylating dioxygenase subunit beta [Novosphingobium sp.]
MSGTDTLEKPAAQATAATLDDLLLHHEISQFLFHEALLQDEHLYSDWEALWTQDAIYWVPANGDDTTDPDMEMSIIYDNRSRIALRIRQLYTGRRYAQEPRSSIRRVLSNIQIDGVEGDELQVSANAMVFESHRRGDVVWACRYKYVLRRTEEGLRMVRKTVLLPNNAKALYTLAFLI